MNPQSAIRNSRFDQILIRGVNWLGDAVLTTPALMRLREIFPRAQITLLTPEKLKDLWAGHPAVNETISFADGESIFSVERKLRAGKFDLALVLPNSPRSAMEPWLARIPQRIGYARPWRNWFLTRAVPPRIGAVKMQKRSIGDIKRLISQLPTPNSQLPTTGHQIHEYLHLAAILGADPGPLAPQLFVSSDEIETAKKKFGLDQITQPVFGLNPGAEYGPAKRWPIERFIAAAKETQQRSNCGWLIFGAAADMPIASQIESAIGNRQSPLFNLAGKTSLRELMALLKYSRVLLTNDSGPMHVAAALGTPVVAPFGSTSPELTGPGLPGDPRHRLLKSDVPCSPCFLRECPIDFRCMTGIAVENIVEALIKA